MLLYVSQPDSPSPWLFLIASVSYCGGNEFSDGCTGLVMSDDSKLMTAVTQNQLASSILHYKLALRSIASSAPGKAREGGREDGHRGESVLRL